MRNKCYLPKSLEELKGLSNEKLQFYWDIFYRYTLRGRKGKYRPLWYAIQGELYNCKLAEKYITRLDKYSVAPEEKIRRANKSYKGKTFQVIVKGESSYEYKEKTYPTLSAVANEITGAHISGPKFFGLTRKQYVQN